MRILSNDEMKQMFDSEKRNIMIVFVKTLKILSYLSQHFFISWVLGGSVIIIRNYPDSPCKIF